MLFPKPGQLTEALILVQWVVYKCIRCTQTDLRQNIGSIVSVTSTSSRNRAAWSLALSWYRVNESAYDSSVRYDIIAEYLVCISLAIKVSLRIMLIRMFPCVYSVPYDQSTWSFLWSFMYEHAFISSSLFAFLSVPFGHDVMMSKEYTPLTWMHRSHPDRLFRTVRLEILRLAAKGIYLWFLYRDRTRLYRTYSVTQKSIGTLPRWTFTIPCLLESIHKLKMTFFSNLIASATLLCVCPLSRLTIMCQAIDFI